MTGLGNQKVILVTGATGNQGGAVVDQLTKTGGWVLRALTRDYGGERAQSLATRGVEIVQGDMEDPTSLDSAMDGVYGVFSVQARGSVVEAEVQQGMNVANAAIKAGIAHLIYTSVCSADRRTAVPHFESKGDIEKYIRGLAIPHTIIRPVSFMENFRRNRESVLEGIFKGFRAPAALNQYIAVQDIGAFAAAAFSRPREFLGQTVDIAGDELTQEEVAKIFGRTLGRPVTYSQITPDPLRPLPEDQKAMNQFMDREGYNVDIPALRARWGIPLMTLEEWVKEEDWTA